MKLVILPLERPSDLIGAVNGDLDPDLLVSVGNRGQLHHAAARAWLALCRCAHQAGFDLTYTFGGTYRTLADQEWLFRSRYVVGGTQGGCRLWDGAMWCKKLVNGVVPASAATPGTSNHGLGLAIDMALDLDPGDGISPDDATNITPALPWLSVNALNFGFSWEGPANNIESWHIRYVTGDHVPQAVIDWEPHAPPPIPNLGDLDMDTKLLLSSSSLGAQFLYVVGGTCVSFASQDEATAILGALRISPTDAGYTVVDFDFSADQIARLQ